MARGKGSKGGGGRPKGGKPKKGRKSGKDAAALPAVSEFVSEAAVGCYSWHGGPAALAEQWMLGRPCPFDRHEFGLSADDAVPDLSLEPEDTVLTVINAHRHQAKSFHITVEHPAFGLDHRPLTPGVTRGEDGVERPCVTLVLLVPPATMVDVCQLELESVVDAKLTSDIVEWHPHPAPEAFDDRCVLDAFPLPTTRWWLCTQGEAGGLTHFAHPSTFHALDFRCPRGTPVLAVGDGEVVDVTQKCCVSGIHVSNLFAWNAVTIALDPQRPTQAAGAAAAAPAERSAGPTTAPGERLAPGGDSRWRVEYVHIQAHSATVKVGDRVTAGQVICRTGDVGFCPEPHLHVEAHASDAPDAPSVRIAWRNGDGQPFTPAAGQWCDGRSVADEPPAPCCAGAVEGELPPPLHTQTPQPSGPPPQPPAPFPALSACDDGK